MISLEQHSRGYYIKFTGKKQQFNEYINKVMFIPGKEWNVEKSCWTFPANQLGYVQGVFSTIEYLDAVEPVTSKIVTGYEKMGKKMKLAPYDYQKEAIKFGIDTLEALLVLPCGSGKTPCGIGMYLEGKAAKAIKGPGMIIVKASLKLQWKKEVAKFSDLTANVILTPSDINRNITLRIQSRKRKLKNLDKFKQPDEVKKIKGEIDDLVLLGKTDFKAQFDNTDLYILNYESLMNAEIRKELHRRKIQFIFADEIHYVKNKDSKRSQALHEFRDTKMKIGATATPVGKNPEDIYGIFTFIAPSLFPSWPKFASSYVKYSGYGRVSGVKNKEHLIAKYAPHTMVKTKEEVSDQLPDLLVIPRHCEMTADQQEMTDKIMLELDDLKEQSDNIRRSCKNELEARNNVDLMKLDARILALQTFAQEICDAPEILALSESEMAKKYLCEDNSSPKIEMLTELIDEIIESGEKVCVFSRFTSIQGILTREILKSKKDIKIAYVSGKLNDKQRYVEVYDKFRDDDDYKVLIMSDAGAEGLNLSKCKYVIELDLAESFGIQTQRHGRVERSDSIHETVFVYQLIAENSWDQVQQKIIGKKEAYDADLIKVLAKS